MSATILTDTKIKNLQPKDKLYRLFDGQGYGLYLEVLPNSSKKWRQKYRHDGRYKAIDQKRLLEPGKDPLTERHKEMPTVFTFE